MEEVGEEEMAGLGGGAALTALAAGELDEGTLDGGQEGEGNGELAELGRVAAVFEGVEVALGGASAVSAAPPPRPAISSSPSSSTPASPASRTISPIPPSPSPAMPQNRKILPITIKS